jgi:hypothetical protein
MSMSRGFVFCLALIGLAASSSAIASAATVTIDGQPVTDAFLKDGHLMIPFREPLEALGATVSWSDATNIASAELNGAQLVTVKIGSTEATVTSHPRTLRAAPVLENHLAYIPVETLQDISYASVQYAPDGQSARVSGWDLAGINDVGSNSFPVLYIWGSILVVGGFSYLIAAFLVARDSLRHR